MRQDSRFIYEADEEATQAVFYTSISNHQKGRVFLKHFKTGNKKGI